MVEDLRARELHGHGILSTERFKDNTRHMIEFQILKKNSVYGRKGDECRLFLNDYWYQLALDDEKKKEIQIKRYAHVIEGHIIFAKKRRR